MAGFEDLTVDDVETAGRPGQVVAGLSMVDSADVHGHGERRVKLHCLFDTFSSIENAVSIAARLFKNPREQRGRYGPLLSVDASAKPVTGLKACRAFQCFNDPTSFFIVLLCKLIGLGERCLAIFLELQRLYVICCKMHSSSRITAHSPRAQ